MWRVSEVSENPDKTASDLTVRKKNVDLLHENIKTLSNEKLVAKNKRIKPLTEIESIVFASLSTVRNNPAIFELQQRQKRQNRGLLRTLSKT